MYTILKERQRQKYPRILLVLNIFLIKLNVSQVKTKMEFS